MDDLIQVTSTDEDELIDIEGDLESVVVTHDNNHYDEASDNLERKNINQIAPWTEVAPFKRQNIDKSLKNEDSSPENDFTKWWKSASDFRRPEPVVGDGLGRGSNGEEEGEQSVKLDPILQIPVSVSIGEETKTSGEEIFCEETGEIFHPPENEVVLTFDVVSEEEREHFPEFFSGRTKYSPHNYTTIRNAILQQWHQRQPEHVNKVMLRPILKKCCGNVNNIGRIHRYLESIGAINFGSDSVWWKTKKRKIPTYRPPRTALDTDFKLKRALEQRMSGRNRKRPAPFTANHSSENAIGGYTIDHANNNAILVSNKKEKKEVHKSPSKKYNLVKCKEYESSEDCQYEVTIDASVLIVMDVHSHLSRHEVMGLMGGYVTNSNTKVKVHITCARPCKSSGSSRHCEMDPVSQSSAYEFMTSRGLKVIGWYHSHPTFPPQPSETDIATQLEQQMMFSAHDSIFLGLILTPYYKHQIKTEVNLVDVRQQLNGNDVSGIPYSVPFEIKIHPPDGSTEAQSELMRTLSEIINSSELQKGHSTSRLPHLLDPIVQGSSITHLDKLLKSLTSFVSSQKETSQSKLCDDTNRNTRCIHENGSHVTSLDSLMTSSLPNVTSVLEEVNDSYSIDQNFPSLSDNGFCESDHELRHRDDVTYLPHNAFLGETFRLLHPGWEIVFDQLKILLLRASENVSKKID